MDPMEILDGTYEKAMPKDPQKQWDECLELVADLKDNLSANRMAIAEISERACFIFRGGGGQLKRSREERSIYTLKTFCKRCGLNDHTVSNWILIKNHIFSKLKEKQQQDFKFTAACFAYSELRRRYKAQKNMGLQVDVDKTEVQEVYEEFHQTKTRRLELTRAQIYFTRLAYQLVENKKLEELPLEVLLKVKASATKVLVRCTELEKVHALNKSPKLKLIKKKKVK